MYIIYSVRTTHRTNRIAYQCSCTQVLQFIIIYYICIYFYLQCIGIIMIVNARSYIRLHLKRERHRRRYTNASEYKDECTVRVVIRIITCSHVWYRSLCTQLVQWRIRPIANGVVQKSTDVRKTIWSSKITIYIRYNGV